MQLSTLRPYEASLIIDQVVGLYRYHWLKPFFRFVSIPKCDWNSSDDISDSYIACISPPFNHVNSHFGKSDRCNFVNLHLIERNDGYHTNSATKLVIGFRCNIIRHITDIKFPLFTFLTSCFVALIWFSAQFVKNVKVARTKQYIMSSVRYLAAGWKLGGSIQVCKKSGAVYHTNR